MARDPDRRQRQSEQLRANLARRKAQDRARSDPNAATFETSPIADPEPGDAAPMTEPRPPVVPHLTVKGARRAIDFYQRAFGAELVFATDIPGTDLVLHAELAINGQAVYLCDENPEFGAFGPDAARPSPVTVHLNEVDVDALYDRAVAAGATGRMAPEDMFWGARYARLTDPFGHAWSFGRQLREVPPEALEALARAAFARD